MAGNPTSGTAASGESTNGESTNGESTNGESTNGEPTSGETVTGPQAPMRADALRNRAKVLAAAKEIFALRGPHVPMEEIARRAAVGVATLYRRFPDRESLIRAVARDTFAHVLDECRAAVADEPGAWDALVRVLRSTRELQLSVQLAIHSELGRNVLVGDPETVRFRAELFVMLDDLVRAAQDEGTLRRDIGGGDVAALLALLLRRPPAADDEPDTAAERALILMLDGLRARDENSALPGDPRSTAEFSGPPGGTARAG